MTLPVIRFTDPTSDRVPLITIDGNVEQYEQLDDGQLRVTNPDGTTTTIRTSVGIAICGSIDNPTTEGLNTPNGQWAIHTNGSPMQLRIGGRYYEWEIPAGLYVYPEDGTTIEFWRGKATTLTTSDGAQVTVPAPREWDHDDPHRPAWTDRLVPYDMIVAEQARIDAATAALNAEAEAEAGRCTT